jgi:hypothetical protein
MATKRRGPSSKESRKASPERRTFGASLTPFVLTLGLALLSFVPRVRESETLVASFWAAVVVLGVWQAVLFLRAKPGSKVLRVELRPQHYVQAAVQLSVYAYWGYYFRPVYDHAWLLLAQLVFAFAFDMLLAFSRRDHYVLGFGPFPIIFSTNLFLWFRDDWFHLQFVMIAVGFLGKEFIRWNRDGRRVHIFNPSAFSLSLFSLVLLATSTTELTWGKEIATTLTFAPYIYLFLFSIGLIVMYFFSITLIAGSAAAVLFGASALYSAMTGVPYFIDSEIPTAVFLGLHLLVTDPSTSPRTPPGKLLFGVLYGLGVFVLYALLGALGVPTFYDKLLCVPLLNLSVRWIDGLVRETRWTTWAPARANLASMAVWAAFFGVMTSVGATDGTHRGDTIPFWEQACSEGRRNACERLLQIESSYCGDHSGWACNEIGRHYTEGKVTAADSALALGYFSRACELRFQAGCINLLAPESLARANPRALDLRLLLREGGTNLMEMPEPGLYARACEHRWTFACPTQPGGGS